MQKLFWRHWKSAFLTLLALAAAAGWLYVIYNENRTKDPIEIVKKHFAFYPDFSHGIWREEQCIHVDQESCQEVTYTVSLKGCGPVKFDWHVFPGENADKTWAYIGSDPKIDEDKYALYAIVNEDSRLIDSPALGKPLPETCQFK